MRGLSPTLSFGIFEGTRQLKALKAKSLATIFNNYNKYCITNGFVERTFNPNSFGAVAYVNPSTGSMLYLVKLS